MERSGTSFSLTINAKIFDTDLAPAIVISEGDITKTEKTKPCLSSKWTTRSFRRNRSTSAAWMDTIASYVQGSYTQRESLFDEAAIYMKDGTLLQSPAY